MPNSDIILSVDPSSTAVGWALMSGPRSVVDKNCGVLRDSGDDWASRICGLRPRFRVVLEIAEHHGAWGVIMEEPPEGFQRRSRETGEWHNRPVSREHCFAFGALYGMAVGRFPWRVVTITPNRWQGGGSRVPKSMKGSMTGKAWRSTLIRNEFPGVDFSDDDGGDLADALGVGQWWFLKGRAQRVVRMKA